MNDVVKREHVAGSIFTGLMLIALGTLFLLDEMDIADFSDVIRRYWPMILVLIGVTKLLDRKIWGGLWLIAIGAWLQMVRLGLFGLTFHDSWPLILVIVGVGMIGRALYDATRRREPASPGERHGA